MKPLALALLLAACASAPRTPDPRAIAIHVSNAYWADVNVFLVCGHQRQRLGTVVMSARGRTFHTRPCPDGSVRFLLDPIGERGVFLTDREVVGHSTAVEVPIAPYLSHTQVWPR